MMETWTFGKKLGVGFAATMTLTLVLAGAATYGLGIVRDRLSVVIDLDARNLILAEKLHAAVEWKSGAYRAYLLSGTEEALADARAAREEALDQLRALRGQANSDSARRLVEEIERAEAAHERSCERNVAQRRAGRPLEEVTGTFLTETRPKMAVLRGLIRRFVEHEEALLARGRANAGDLALTTSRTLVLLAALVALLSLAIAAYLTRSLTAQIGSAVRHVQSSSAELQAAATQQATGAREQTTAMSEITTTISELLATSKQIAESAQRVSHIAEQTNASARSGGGTVDRAQEQFASIRKQVDAIVTHMLQLGKRSQQIGGVLDIINELAEQTNILAINATIEAVGAGESGRRFAVVADEIRKLADRVGASTKEIRGLVEDVRASVNTTVMVTEDGTKAVDAGARQFSEVTTALKQIVTLVTTTMEAAREIELSTKQQTTAVSQVNLAIANVAQATKETEASSNQTLQTATELATLSRDLTRLIDATRSA